MWKHLQDTFSDDVTDVSTAGAESIELSNWLPLRVWKRPSLTVVQTTTLHNQLLLLDSNLVYFVLFTVWKRRLMLRHKLTMHTAFAREDNSAPAAITSLLVSKWVLRFLSTRTGATDFLFDLSKTCRPSNKRRNEQGNVRTNEPSHYEQMNDIRANEPTNYQRNNSRININ